MKLTSPAFPRSAPPRTAVAAAIAAAPVRNSLRSKLGMGTPRLRRTSGRSWAVFFTTAYWEASVCNTHSHLLLTILVCVLFSCKSCESCRKTFSDKMNRIEQNGKLFRVIPVN